jgi:hypothetical protein
MKSKIFISEQQFDGTYQIFRYDVLKKDYFPMENEINFSLGEARERTKELNKDIDPVEID